jgi:hypothetical protein
LSKAYARIEQQRLEDVVGTDRLIERTLYEEVDFWRCRFERCTWTSCKFVRISFAHSTRFRDCRFISCKFLLQHTYIGGPSYFENCVFEDCDFQNVQLWQAHFESCRLSGKLQNIRLYGPAAPAEWQSTFVDVDLTGARLLDVDFVCGFDLGSTKLPAGFENPSGLPEEALFWKVQASPPPMLISCAENPELNLKYVCAADCVTDDNIDKVVQAAKNTGSEGLSLLNASLSEAGIHALSHLPRLSYLVLDGSTISGSGEAALGELKNLRDLEHLSLVRTSVTAHFLERIGPLPRLRFLDLSQTLADDLVVAALANCSSLRILRLSATRITERSIAPLVRLPALKIVWLDGNKLPLKATRPFRSRPDVQVSI